MKGGGAGLNVVSAANLVERVGTARTIGAGVVVTAGL
jgi:hypothetical protein